jgi:hypothetical protein
MSSAVALATRKTIAGLSFFPPAPNICSAAASNKGWRFPTMFLRFSAICSMSSRTGPKIWLEDIVGELLTQSPPAGAAPFSSGLPLPFCGSAALTLVTCTVDRPQIGHPQTGQVHKVTTFCGDGRAATPKPIPGGPDIGQGLKAMGWPGS